MSNLEITFAVIAIALAQALTILLTIGRERDIKELRELVNELREHVDEQRLRIVELRAWLAGRNAAQPKAPEPAITTNELPETRQPRANEDEAAPAAKSLIRSREIVAGQRRFGQKGDTPPEPAITDLPNTTRPGTTEAELEWFKADADEASEIVDDPKGVAEKLARTGAPEPAIAPNDLPDTTRSSTTEAELERITKAINWFKENADKAHKID